MLRARRPVDRLQRCSENVGVRVRETPPQQACAGRGGRAGRSQLSDAALPSATVSYRFQPCAPPGCAQWPYFHMTTLIMRSAACAHTIFFLKATALL